MNPKWAEENLQTIRTLMERSAVYRRALAPIMIFIGAAGTIGGIVGLQIQIKTTQGFAFFWISMAVVALGGSLYLIRRQALKETEPFWSAPTRRMAHAFTPAFIAGAVVVIPIFVIDWRETYLIWWLPSAWAILYGLALNAAGFFMMRGIRLFGLIFLIAGLVEYLIGTCLPRFFPPLQQEQIIMTVSFGGLHLIYGIYLYFTEKKNPVA